MNKKVLFVVTSNEDFGTTGKKTGLWLEEFTAPYYHLLDNKVEITVASPKGGKAPIDPLSAMPEYKTPSSERFYNDLNAQNIIQNTKKLLDMSSNDFDAIFYPGGHGPLWDLVEDKHSIKLIEDFYNNDKIISFLCHSVALLKHPKTTNGTPIVKDKKVTGYSSSEEEVLKTKAYVPFLIEDMIQENKGIYSKAGDFKPYVVTDELLITGQNPDSSVILAHKLYEILLKNSKDAQ